MYVNRIEITELTPCAASGPDAKIDAVVAFHYDGATRGTAHFQCSTDASDLAGPQLVRRALIEKARRQLSRMPEFLLRQEELTFAEGLLA